MPRALYIVGKEKVKVMADGPSLWVEKCGRAGQRIPLKYISRVYLFGHVEVSGEALIQLAENNIVLIVLKLSGEGKAVLLPFNHRLPKYHKLQRVILENQFNLKRYIEWLDTYRSYFQLMTIRKFISGFENVPEIGEGDYQIYVKSILAVKEELISPVRKMNRSLLGGLIAEEIIKANLDIHYGGYFRRVNFGFLLDFAYILDSLPDELTILFFKQKDWKDYFVFEQNKIQLNDDGTRNIINRFENKKEQIKDKINNVIDDYFALIRELST